MSDLPEPLVPAEVDLRDFAFMPLDVQRLRDSRFSSVSTGEEFTAGILLWCAAWHQVPCASLPDDDVELAKLAGFGKVVKEWRKVREGALYGWTTCRDGRLYHSVIAEKARESWDSKLRHAYDRMCDRARKKGIQRADLPTFDDWNSGGRVDPHPPEPTQPSDGIPAENALKGQGQGQGKEEKEKGRAGASPPLSAPPIEDPPPEANGHAPTVPGLMCRAMRRAGFAEVNPGDPRLIALCDQGATEVEFVAVAEEAAQKRKGWAWLLKVLENRRAEARAIELAPPPVTDPDAWQQSRTDVINRGLQLGVGEYDQVAAYAGSGPSWSAYRKRVIEADAKARGQHA